MKHPKSPPHPASLVRQAFAFLLALGLLACGTGKDQPSPHVPADAAALHTDTALPADTAIDASESPDLASLGLTACEEIRISDPETILATVPGQACLGCLLCKLGPVLEVCGEEFGTSVVCSCSNGTMSCTDERPNAQNRETLRLTTDAGEPCPTPSWPTDAGAARTAGKDEGG